MRNCQNDDKRHGKKQTAGAGQRAGQRQADLNAFFLELLKLTVETALNAELTEHLGYEKYQNSAPGKGNTRNGSTVKRLKVQHGEVEIEVPRAP